METTRAKIRTLTAGLLVGLAGLTAAPSPARAQDENAEARLRRALPPEDAARVRELAGELEREGIPPALVRRKALEGVAKGVPPERILAALDEYAGRLRGARSLIGPERSGASLAAAAEASRRGVPPDAIRELAQRRERQRELAVPLIVLGELVEAGVPTGRALAAVEDALDRGAGPDGMMAFSAAVRRRIRMGEDPALALERARVRATERFERTRDGPDATRRRTPPGRPTDAAPVPPGSRPPAGGDGRQPGPG
jgi:hypothetical protein